VACFHPLKGYLRISKDGVRSVVFGVHGGYRDKPVSVPCGQCIGCRLERSRQWAIRCAHEASLHERNCFITLTFDDEHIPSDRSLDVRTFQLFMKRLRKRFGDGIRFFHCGEYGETFGRPHYHACLFNFDFEDKVLFKESRGNRLYISESLRELWPFGFSIIGDVTFQSAAYVARYIIKKITGAMAEERYSLVDKVTGELHQIKPEYTTMSRRPGIGALWYERFREDVYPSDFVVMNGKKMKPPKYYDRQYEVEYPSDFEVVKQRRTEKNRKRKGDNVPERLQVREKCTVAKLKRLRREIEEND